MGTGKAESLKLSHCAGGHWFHRIVHTPLLLIKHKSGIKGRVRPYLLHDTPLPSLKTDKLAKKVFLSSLEKEQHQDDNHEAENVLPLMSSIWLNDSVAIF